MDRLGRHCACVGRHRQIAKRNHSALRCVKKANTELMHMLAALSALALNFYSGGAVHGSGDTDSISTALPSPTI